MLSRSIYVVAKGNIFFFFYLWWHKNPFRNLCRGHHSVAFWLLLAGEGGRGREEERGRERERERFLNWFLKLQEQKDNSDFFKHKGKRQGLCFYSDIVLYALLFLLCYLVYLIMAVGRCWILLYFVLFKKKTLSRSFKGLRLKLAPTHIILS